MLTLHNILHSLFVLKESNFHAKIKLWLIWVKILLYPITDTEEDTFDGLKI